MTTQQDTTTNMIPRAPHTKPIAWLLCAMLASVATVALYAYDASSSRAQDRVVSHATMHKRFSPGPRKPMPVGNIPGWHQVFSDNFNGNRLDRSKWRLYWGKPGGDPAGWFDPRHVFVKNGLLTISAYRDRRDGGRWATGGVSSSPGLIQTYGKYLVRFRLDRGYGVGHAALLMPADNSWPPEIDFSEDNGSSREGTLATLHFGPHDTHWSASLNRVNLTQWHTLGIQWTPDKLQWTIDGRIWKTMSGSNIPNIPMVLDLQTQTWPCTGSWGVCPNSSTPRKVNMYVDWAVGYAPNSNAHVVTSLG